MIKSALVFTIPICLFVCIWALLSYFVHIPDYILPGPIEVLNRTISDSSVLLLSLYSTVYIALFGALLAVAVALILAMVASIISRGEGSFVAVLILLQSIPVIVLAPVLNVWLGNAAMARVIVAALFAIFPLAISLVRALQDPPVDLVLFARAVGCGRLQLYRYVLIPCALGGFFTGLRVSVPLALVGSIVGELSGASTGIGYLMQVAQRRLDMELLFAGVVTSAVAGLLLYSLTIGLERVLVPWRRSAVDG